MRWVCVFHHHTAALNAMLLEQFGQQIRHGFLVINATVLIKRHHPHGGAHGEIIIGAAKAGISLFGAGNYAGDDAFNIAINGDGQHGTL